MPPLIAFPDLADDEPFRTALPVIANLAAGPLQAGFQTASLDDLADCAWVRVPPRVAKPGRFVVRIAGESMSPTLRPGDLVVFEYHRTPRADGQIVIVADFPTDDAPGDCAVKRYRAAPNAWRFTSDNQAYPDVCIPKSTRPAHPILGIAVWDLTRGYPLSVRQSDVPHSLAAWAGG
jgi:phage repressor protein C with HTH and peptisase S24 domain